MISCGFNAFLYFSTTGLAGPAGAPAYPNAPYVINQEPYMQTLIAGEPSFRLFSFCICS